MIRLLRLKIKLFALKNDWFMTFMSDFKFFRKLCGGEWVKYSNIENHMKQIQWRIAKAGISPYWKVLQIEYYQDSNFVKKVNTEAETEMNKINGMMEAKTSIRID